MPTVDDGRLKGVLRNLRQLRDELVAVGSQYLQPLAGERVPERDQAPQRDPGRRLRVRPAGVQPLAAPRLTSERIADIERWMSTVRPLCNSIAELLWLVRESTPPTQQVAVNGVYHHVLSKEGAGRPAARAACRRATALYPEISGSHHRFTMRFMQWSDRRAGRSRRRATCASSSRSAELASAARCSACDDRPIGLQQARRPAAGPPPPSAAAGPRARGARPRSASTRHTSQQHHALRVSVPVAA